MPVSLSIKAVPDAIVERLRRRAAGNHRSLQRELMAIVEAAVLPEPRAAFPTPVRAVALSAAESEPVWQAVTHSASLHRRFPAFLQASSAISPVT